jgi:hypothetical protein
MQAPSNCPFCNSTLRFNRDTFYAYQLGISDDFIEKWCVNNNDGYSYFIMADVNNKVLALSFSLNIGEVFFDVYINMCYAVLQLSHNAKLPSLEVSTIPTLDFPHLKKFREEVKLFLTFS